MGTIVILGASGFLGPHVVSAALAASDGDPTRVVAVSRRPERRPDREAAAVAERSLDLAAPGALEGLVELCADATVIHAAGLTRAAACERDPELARRLNAEVPEALARLLHAGTIRRLVHVSTDLVFGATPPGGGRYGEAEIVSPCNVYGETKALGEERVLAADPRALIVRLPLLYGPSFGRGLGASDQVTDAVERGERPFLFTDEFRTPLDVRDAARALVAAAQRYERGILHVAGPARLSRLELGLLALHGAGLDVAAARAAVDAGPRAERGAGGRAADVSLDAARAAETLGVPLRSPAEALNVRFP